MPRSGRAGICDDLAAWVALAGTADQRPGGDPSIGRAGQAPGGLGRGPGGVGRGSAHRCRCRSLRCRTPGGEEEFVDDHGLFHAPRPGRTQRNDCDSTASGSQPAHHRPPHRAGQGPGRPDASGWQLASGFQLVGGGNRTAGSTCLRTQPTVGSTCLRTQPDCRLSRRPAPPTPVSTPTGHHLCPADCCRYRTSATARRTGNRRGTRTPRWPSTWR